MTGSKRNKSTGLPGATNPAWPAGTPPGSLRKTRAAAARPPIRCRASPDRMAHRCPQAGALHVGSVPKSGAACRLDHRRRGVANLRMDSQARIPRSADAFPRPWLEPPESGVEPPGHGTIRSGPVGFSDHSGSQCSPAACRLGHKDSAKPDRCSTSSSPAAIASAAVM